MKVDSFLPGHAPRPDSGWYSTTACPILAPVKGKSPSSGSESAVHLRIIVQIALVEVAGFPHALPILDPDRPFVPADQAFVGELLQHAVDVHRGQSDRVG